MKPEAHRWSSFGFFKKKTQLSHDPAFACHANSLSLILFFFFLIKNHGLKLLTAVNEKKLK
jgi:hypothetical protein